MSRGVKNIKDLLPTGPSTYSRGLYQVKNRDKYLGDPTRVIYRSSWEYKIAEFCDLNENVISWSSEPGAISYISPIDNRQHKYFVDFYIKVKKSEDTFKEYLIEVKPMKDITKPIFEGAKTLKKLQSHNKQIETYITNMAKFQAAREYCERRGYEFALLTESNFNGFIKK